MTKNTQKRPYRVFCLTHRTACLQRFSTITGLHKPYILGLYKPNNMKQKHDTQTKASQPQLHGESGTMLRGDIGVYWTQLELAKNGVASDYIDKTNDVYLWERKHNIEVKTAKETTTVRTGKKMQRNTYEFKFDEYQCQKDSFDYAVCVGLDDDDNVENYYIIPQPFIHHIANKKRRKDSKVSFSILKRPSKSRKYCNTYDKFEICKNIGFDLFRNDNKASFTRKKNYMTKKLIEYGPKCRENFKKEFIEYFKNGGTIKGAMDKFQMYTAAITDYRVKFGLTVRAKDYVPVSYTCKKCGYTTNNKYKYKRHLNRENPCDRHKRWRAK